MGRWNIPTFGVAETPAAAKVVSNRDCEWITSNPESGTAPESWLTPTDIPSVVFTQNRQ
jgi:hypothetical protein